MQPAHEQKCTAGEQILAVSLELSQSSWKLALHDGAREKARLQTVKGEGARERLGQVVEVIEQTKKKWGLEQAVRVAVVYEAGQDGFWISRALVQAGYQVLVVDGASILVQRHLARERGQLQKEVQQHRDRLRKLLRTVGCWDTEGDLGRC
jgi:transposase